MVLSTRFYGILLEWDCKDENAAGTSLETLESLDTLHAAGGNSSILDTLECRPTSSQISNAVIFHRDGQAGGFLNFLTLDILKDNLVRKYTRRISVSNIPRLNTECDPTEVLTNETPNVRTRLLSLASSSHETYLAIPKSTTSRQNWMPGKRRNTASSGFLGQQNISMSSLCSAISDDETDLDLAGDPLSREGSMVTISDLEQINKPHSYSAHRRTSGLSGIRATGGRLRKIVRRIISALRHSRRETMAIKRETRATRIVGAILGNFFPSLVFLSQPFG